MTDTKDAVALALDLAEHLALDVCGNGHPPGDGCSACDVWHAIDTAGLVDAQEQIARLRSALEEARGVIIACHGNINGMTNAEVRDPIADRILTESVKRIDAALASRKEV